MPSTQEAALLQQARHYLNSSNNIRRVPSLALRKASRVGELVLDNNLFRTLERGAIHDVKVVNLSISSCDYLTSVEEGSVTRLPLLESLLITRNPSLVYLHPRAVQQVPSLATLQLAASAARLGLLSLPPRSAGSRWR